MLAQANYMRKVSVQTYSKMTPAGSGKIFSK